MARSLPTENLCLRLKKIGYNLREVWGVYSEQGCIFASVEKEKVRVGYLIIPTEEKDRVEVSLDYYVDGVEETLDFKDCLERESIPYEENKEVAKRVAEMLRERAKRDLANANRLEGKVVIPDVSA